MTKIKMCVVFCFLVFLITGCDVLRTSPGGEVLINKDIKFYLAIGDSKYREISEELGTIFISDAEWYASDGITLVDPVVKTYPAMVTWQTGDKEYSVPGIGVSIKVKIIIDKTAQPEKKQVYVEFPNIKLLSNSMGVQPKTGSDNLSNRMLVGQVNVHSSGTMSTVATWVSGILTVLGILIVLGILAGLSH